MVDMAPPTLRHVDQEIEGWRKCATQLAQSSRTGARLMVMVSLLSFAPLLPCSGDFFAFFALLLSASFGWPVALRFFGDAVSAVFDLPGLLEAFTSCVFPAPTSSSFVCLFALLVAAGMATSYYS